MLMNPLCNRLSLRQATRRVTQLCDQALAPLDLRATQLSMLREIDRLGPIALDPLAEAMVMDRATPDHNVRSLEMRGLVRLAVGADRPSRQVTLTPKGRALLARALGSSGARRRRCLAEGQMPAGCLRPACW